MATFNRNAHLNSAEPRVIPDLTNIIPKEPFMTEPTRYDSRVKPLLRKPFAFDAPPEAPLFEPTEEQFEYPIAYINQIRPIAEMYGICKIKPPASWRPPFALDKQNFIFTPRIQRLNQLEAITRVKLNFLDQLARFWELQGSSLTVPIVERKPLDLYSLYKCVQNDSPLPFLARERNWIKITADMGYKTCGKIPSLLKKHYDKILHPYDLSRFRRKHEFDLQEINELNLKLEQICEAQGINIDSYYNSMQQTPPKDDPMSSTGESAVQPSTSAMDVDKQQEIDQDNKQNVKGKRQLKFKLERIINVKSDPGSAGQTVPKHPMLSTVGGTVQPSTFAVGIVKIHKSDQEEKQQWYCMF